MRRTAALLVALAVGASAARADKPPPPRTQPGQLDVFDAAKLFSPAGIDKAKETFRAAEFHNGLAVTVDTVTAPPAGKLRGEAEAAHRDEAKWRAFMTQWARDTAKADKAKGIYVLVTLQPVGGIAVLADAQTTRRGFTEENDRKVRELFGAAFKEANKEPDETKKQAIRSGALLKAVEYIAADLKGTRVADAGGGEKAGRNQDPATDAPPSSPVMGYLCLGLSALAGVWLVIAVVRMFSGGGGPGGGGGGGFFPSLLGGLFGAAAGMWMYSHFFGGGGGMFGGSDAHAGDAGGGDAGGGDTGAGDWGGGSADAGGFDGGGGDFGGDF